MNLDTSIRCEPRKFPPLLPRLPPPLRFPRYPPLDEPPRAPPRENDGRERYDDAEDENDEGLRWLLVVYPPAGRAPLDVFEEDDEGPFGAYDVREAGRLVKLRLGPPCGGRALVFLNIFLFLEPQL